MIASTQLAAPSSPETSNSRRVTHILKLLFCASFEMQELNLELRLSTFFWVELHI